MFFSLFKKKESRPSYEDWVWPTHTAKLNGISMLLQQHPNAVLAAWFPATIQELEQLPGMPAVVPAARLRSSQVEGRMLIVAGHYPLPQKEDYLLHLPAAKILFCSALDEPFFMHFGSEKISGILQQLGSSESEPLQHNLITQSIRRAQEKLALMVHFEQNADSDSEWFRKNKVV